MVSVDGGESRIAHQDPRQPLHGTVANPVRGDGRAGGRCARPIVVKKTPKEKVVNGPYMWSTPSWSTLRTWTSTSPSSISALVRLAGIRKRYGAVEALRGVDLDVAEGEASRSAATTVRASRASSG
jgi:hypothetical protein